MERRGQLLACSVPSVVHASPTISYTLPVRQRPRTSKLRLFICLALVTNVPGVGAFKFSRTNYGARRHSRRSSKQGTTRVNGEGSNSRRKKAGGAFRLAQLLPVSWTFRSQLPSRKRTTLRPLQESTTESETSAADASAADSTRTSESQSPTPTQREPQAQPPKSPGVHLQLQELADNVTTTTTTTTTTTSNTTPKDDTEQLPQPDSSNGDSDTNSNINSNTNKTQQHAASTSTTSTQVQIHTFVDAETGHTWKALHTHRNKFYAFLQHHLNGTTILSPNDIVTETITLSEESDGDDADGSGDSDSNENSSQELRQEWRALWKQRRLVTDRTELLAVYPSDKAATSASASTTDGSGTDTDTKVAVSPSPKHKRGGFADLLYLYTERLVSIIRDEHTEIGQQIKLLKSDQQQENTNMNMNGVTDKDPDNDQNQDESMLLDWLKSTYGKDATELLRAGNLGLLDETSQLAHWKHFLEWFRAQFPYYYDRCGTCGASMREDKAARPAPAVDNNHDSNDNDGTLSDNDGDTDDHSDNLNHEHDDDDDDENQTFVGYIYPDDVELQGKASRTEIYHCHQCQSFTRFPRYNSVTHVIEHNRGRCGEYSMLLYRVLRALGHEARWVVDWADHVWAEVAVHGDSDNSSGSRRWVHLDPCEAAVDENFIYQGWGKKQTYILGFYAPPSSQRRRGVIATTDTIGTSAITSLDGSEATTQAQTRTTPIIEDITASYTTESWDEICKRRDESEDEIRASMAKAIADLAPKLLNVGKEGGHEHQT
jgi:hypothetical protein